MLLVTGATGFLGSNVMREIARAWKDRKDVRILASDFENARKMYPKFEVVKGDVTAPETLAGIGKDVDAVLHLAGMVSYTRPRHEILSVNAEGTKNVLDACRKADRFVFASSVSVYGKIQSGRTADEAYPIRPGNAYGESKAAAEYAISESGIRSVILRIAPIYGAGSPQWLKNLSLLEKGFPIPRTDNLTHVAHVSNAARAFALALKAKARGAKDAKGVYNIADPEPVKFMDFASDLMTLLGKEPKVVPFWFISLIARMKGLKAYLDVLTMNRSYDVSAAREKLGYDPSVDFSAELRKMVEWYKTTAKQNSNENGK